MRMISIALLLFAFGQKSFATPLVTDSETSLAQVCINYDDTDERIVEICSLALANANQSTPGQILQMHKSLGDAYVALDQREQGLAEYTFILDQNPNSRGGHLGLGWYYLGEDPELSAASFRRAAAVMASAEAVAGGAKARFMAGMIDFDQMLEQLDAALAIDPKYGWAMREKGWQLIEADRKAEAAKVFSQAITSNAGDLNAYAGRAKALEWLDPEQALLDINRSLQAEPDDTWSLILRAKILFYRDRFRQTIRDGDHIIAVAPDVPDGYVYKARALAELGKRKAGLDVLAQAYAAAGMTNLGFLRYWQASLLSDDGDYRAAKRVLRNAFDQGTADRFDGILMAYVLLEQGRNRQAMKHIETVLAEAPDWYLPHFYKAKLLALMRKPTEAIAAYEVMHDLGSEPWMLGEFAAALVKRGFYVQAIRARLQFAGE